ncbi:hypothetical protein [Robertmurraya sp. P23]|uniref:hypothetical protein n=1 Tax=Robertmurraya sp. P23 TaxID=3436931 RepID=UPI003D97AE01
MKSRWSVWLERTDIYRWLFGATVILYFFSGDYISKQTIRRIYLSNSRFIMC